MPQWTACAALVRNTTSHAASSPRLPAQPHRRHDYRTARPRQRAKRSDEAWEIAERGPMPLFKADIHLYRARLFFGVTPYPWVSPRDDLAQARALIEKHGYWRRKEELEDAEAAILRRP
jgi:hypothetical protein